MSLLFPYTLPRDTRLNLRHEINNLDKLISCQGVISATITDSVDIKKRPGCAAIYYDLHNMKPVDINVVFDREDYSASYRGQLDVCHAFILYRTHKTSSTQYFKDCDIYISSLASDDYTHENLSVARDAFLSSDKKTAIEIAKQNIRFGWPLFIALLDKEQRLLNKG